ncbi:uncharacterized protein LOC122643729 [Telopea speciosissima]|uniref:uncharacterized protein LOC122643729 n=1 Tax=Telopea speciosissima TaxID=54955 RepID=UPI001CC3E7A5|nr:uncharacterized protein LOC122643729 [Telopea speciosissima]
MGGYGAIGRDSRGRPVFALAGGLQNGDVIYMELFAIRAGLLKARTMQIQQVQVRSDSMVAVQMIVGTFQPHWEFLGLLEEIRSLRDGFRNCSFNHHVREINGCADFLAGFVHHVEEVDFCITCLPEALSSLIRNDASSMTYYRL